MVFYVLDALRKAGVQHFVVNLHAHPAAVRKALVNYGKRCRVRVTFLHEKKLLDTGGALQNARCVLTEPFWLVNCDFFPEGFSFQTMERVHRRSGALATLAVRPKSALEPYNPVGVDRRGRLVRVSGVYGRGGRNHVFLGVHRIEPMALVHLSDRKKFPIFDGFYRNLFSAGLPVHTFSAGQHLTFDLGTLEGYFSANFA